MASLLKGDGTRAPPLAVAVPMIWADVGAVRAVGAVRVRMEVSAMVLMECIVLCL